MSVESALHVGTAIASAMVTPAGAERGYHSEGLEYMPEEVRAMRATVDEFETGAEDQD